MKTAALGTAGLAMPGRLKASGPRLRLGYLPITDATPLLVAHGLGYFGEEGLDVERPIMVRSWNILTESFLAGKFDLTHMPFPIPVWMRFNRNVPVKVLAWDHTNGSAVTVRGDSDIFSFKDFGGKTVAVPSWYSMHNLILQLGLTTQGLTPVIRHPGAALNPNEVNLITLTPRDMPTALLSRKIEGYIVADPFNALAQVRFKARIMRFSGDIWKNHPCCVIVGHERYIRLNPIRVQKAMNAIVRAQAWCMDNPRETAHLLSRDGEGYLPVPKSVLQRVFDNPGRAELVHPDWDVERIGFQPYPFPSATRFIINQMKQTRVEGDTGFLQALDTDTAAQSLVDDRFVLKAMDEIGGMRTFCHCDMKQPYTREEIVEIN